MGCGDKHIQIRKHNICRTKYWLQVTGSTYYLAFISENLSTLNCPHECNGSLGIDFRQLIYKIMLNFNKYLFVSYFVEGTVLGLIGCFFKEGDKTKSTH